MKTRHVIWAVGIVLAFLFAYSARPADALIITNPPSVLHITAIQDTFVFQNAPNTNECTQARVNVVAISTGFTERALFKFSMTDLPSNAQILSAKFAAYIDYGTVSGDLTYDYLLLSKITAAWSECTVTWNNQPTVGSSMSQQVSNDSFTLPQPFLFDITGIVEGWQQTPSSNNGIRISFSDDTIMPFRQLYWFSYNSTYGKPYVDITYIPPTATVYPAFYCSGGPCETGILSGSGLPAYLFNITYAENNGTFRRAPRPDLLLTNVSTYFTLRGSDFFGNLLFNQSKVVTSSIFLWVVQIPYGIFQVYSMRDTFTSVSVKPSGGTAMLFDLPPRAWWALPLKTGVSYWLNFTLLNGNFASVATIDIVRTMGQKLSFIVNGTTLQEVSQNLSGNWQVTNETKGLTAGVGNALLAPKGLDFFKTLAGPPGYVIFGLNVWTVLLAAIIIMWVLFVRAYRSRLRRNAAKWPARVQAWFVSLNVLTFLLFLSAIIFISSGSFTIPFPISTA